MAHEFTARSLLVAIICLNCSPLVLAQETAPSMPVETKPAGSEVVSGMLLGERMQLLQKIMKAKQQGCGVTGYMSAFTEIQESCKSGQPEGPIRQRLQSLSKALDEQLERSKVLKTQRLPPGSMNAGAAMPGASSPRGSGGMDQLMAKYGNKLPPDVNKQALLKRLGQGADGTGNLSADDVMKKFAESGKAKDALDSPKVRDMLEKFKSGNGL
jgi:hypothetical protein